MEEVEVSTNLLVLDICPECGRPTWSHDHEQRRYVCINGECGYVEAVSEVSIWARLMERLRLKKK
jgi:ribosomal protein S27AE